MKTSPNRSARATILQASQRTGAHQHPVRRRLEHHDARAVACSTSRSGSSFGMIVTRNLPGAARPAESRNIYEAIITNLCLSRCAQGRNQRDCGQAKGRRTGRACSQFQQGSELADGRFVLLTRQPMEGGGWLSHHRGHHRSPARRGRDLPPGAAYVLKPELPTARSSMRSSMKRASRLEAERWLLHRHDARSR